MANLDWTIRTQVSKFSQWALACSYSERTVKPSVVLHGDDGMFWVASLAVAAKLERAGYEIVK